MPPKVAGRPRTRAVGAGVGSATVDRGVPTLILTAPVLLKLILPLIECVPLTVWFKVPALLRIAVPV